MRRTDFDALLIGASPLMLMRGIALASAGARVAHLERSDAPGGSWGAPALLGFRTVEAGVHLLEARRAFYGALAATPGLSLRRSPPRHDFGLWRGRRIPLGATRAVFHAAVAVRALARGEGDKASRIAMSAVRTAANLGCAFHYPDGGAAAITRALMDQLRRLGGEVRFGVGVEAIRADPDRKAIRCETSAGLFQSERVTISSRAHAPIFVGDELQAPEAEQSTCHSVVAHVTGQPVGGFGYVEVLGDPAIKRVRDVGVFSDPRPAMQDTLLCLQLRRPFQGADEDLGPYCGAELSRLGLLAPSAVVTAASRQDFHLTTITDRWLQRLGRRCGGLLDVLRTTDFADGYLTAGRSAWTPGAGGRMPQPASPARDPS